MKTRLFMIIVIILSFISIFVISTLSDNLNMPKTPTDVAENQTQLNSFSERKDDESEEIELEEEINEDVKSHIYDQSDKNEEAIKTYMEFINGERPLGKEYVDDLTTPTGEPNNRYNTGYAFWDCNRDGLKDLLFFTGKYSSRYIITYKDEDLEILNCWNGGHESLIPLNNGNFLLHTYFSWYDGYSYVVFDVNGNEIVCDNFGYTCNYDHNNKKNIYIYKYNDVEITEELYNKLANKYFEIGSDKIEWFTLYKNYYDGENHMD